jgi:hypothetical protein
MEVLAAAALVPDSLPVSALFLVDSIVINPSVPAVRGQFP